MKNNRYVIISGVWLGIVDKNYIDIDSVPDLSGYARHFARESDYLMRIWSIAFRYYAPRVDAEYGYLERTRRTKQLIWLKYEEKRRSIHA